MLFRSFSQSARLFGSASLMALGALVLTTGPLMAQVPQQEPKLASAQAKPVARPSARLSEGIAALVNDDIVSTYDLRQRMLLLIVTSGVQPTQETMAALQQQALRSLIDERLEMQELKKFDVKIDDAEVDEQISTIARQNNLQPQQLVANLKSAGVDIQTLRAQIRAEIGWSNLVNGRFRSRSRVGEDQVSVMMDRISESNTKTQYLIGEIFIDATQAGGKAAAAEGAKQLFDQMRGGAPFQAVARQFSSLPNASVGGDAGWQTLSDLNPQVEKVVSGLQDGQLSAPIETDDGYYLVLLRQKREGGGTWLFSLKQALYPVSDAGQLPTAEKALSQVSSRYKGCSSLDGLNEAGVRVSSLGDNNANDLNPDIAVKLSAVSKGQLSAPIRTSAGLAVFALCDKYRVGENIPTKEDVSNRLTGQQLSMLGKRYLRDLRNQATIETR